MNQDQNEDNQEGASLENKANGQYCRNLISYGHLIEELKESSFVDDSSSYSSSSPDYLDLFEALHNERQTIKIITLAEASKMSHN